MQDWHNRNYILRTDCNPPLDRVRIRSGKNASVLGTVLMNDGHRHNDGYCGGECDDYNDCDAEYCNGDDIRLAPW